MMALEELEEGTQEMNHLDTPTIWKWYGHLGC